MNLSLELVGICLVVPATAAALVVWGALRFDSARLAERFALPCGAAAAFISAYVLLPEWAALTPDRHWHWLPYLAAAAALVGPAGTASGSPAWLRWLVLLALATGTAFLVVPSWDTLRPARPASIAVLAAYLSVLMLALDRLSRRISSAWLLAVFALTGCLLAGLLADNSVRFAQLAGIAAAAFAGCWFVIAIAKRNATVDIRGAVPIYGVLMGGMAYVGCIEPEEPLWWLLLIPTIPLTVGLAARFVRQYRASAGSAQ